MREQQAQQEDPIERFEVMLYLLHSDLTHSELLFRLIFELVLFSDQFGCSRGISSMDVKGMSLCWQC